MRESECSLADSSDKAHEEGSTPNMLHFDYGWIEMVGVRGALKNTGSSCSLSVTSRLSTCFFKKNL